MDSPKFLIALALVMVITVYGFSLFVGSAVQNETGVMHENITRLANQVKEQQVVIDKLNEVVGKTEDGKELNRIDTYDLISGVVINSIQQGNNK